MAVTTRLSKIYIDAVKPYSMALGYPVNRSHAFKIDLKKLGLIKNTLASSYLNNIGSPYSQGKYTSDNAKSVEIALLKLLGAHFNLATNEIFGYVTNGGTEANFTAIWWHRENLKANFGENPVLIASDKSHYSLDKIANQLQLELIKIKTNNSNICIQDLEKKLCNISKPVIFWANIGTTVEGIIDNVIIIQKTLRKYFKEKFRIHGDGALYGLVIPYLSDYEDTKYIFDYLDTLSISTHKLLGAYFISGIVLCKKNYIQNIIRPNNIINYLQDIDDVTFSGSRSGFLAIEIYLLLQKALKTSNNKTRLFYLWHKCLSRADWFYNEIIKIIDKDNPHLIFNKNQLNIVIPAPKNKKYKNLIAEKYRLMEFGNSQFGICILPRSTKKILKKFLIDYKKIMT